MRVQAVTPGFYASQYCDIGDVFDLASPADLSDSTVSQVPVGNPLYPYFGWMLVVSGTTPLFRWASMGFSSPVNGIYQSNAAGAKNLSIPRYVA